MSREYTTDEIRRMFLSHINNVVMFWSNEEDRTELEKLEGVAFSILAALDGCSMALPSFIVAPRPHETDKEYRKEEGSNWYPENHEIEDKIKGDISGCLHELLHRVKD